jgi:hypothetical protein
MSELAKMGVTAQRRFLSQAGDDSDEEHAEVTELGYTLPKSYGVRATFAAESWGTALRKVFQKEIQTGDELFDDAVNIRTDTEEATVALLKSADICASIESVVVGGGVIELDDAALKIEMPGRHDVSLEVAMNVVRTLVGAL